MVTRGKHHRRQLDYAHAGTRRTRYTIGSGPVWANCGGLTRLTCHKQQLTEWRTLIAPKRMGDSASSRMSRFCDKAFKPTRRASSEAYTAGGKKIARPSPGCKSPGGEQGCSNAFPARWPHSKMLCYYGGGHTFSITASLLAHDARARCFASLLALLLFC